MKIDFNNLRKLIATDYNSLVSELNDKTDHTGVVRILSGNIQNELDSLRSHISFLLACYEPGQFESLDVDLESFNPEGK